MCNMWSNLPTPLFFGRGFVALLSLKVFLYIKFRVKLVFFLPFNVSFVVSFSSLFSRLVCVQMQMCRLIHLHTIIDKKNILICYFRKNLQRIMPKQSGMSCSLQLYKKTHADVYPRSFEMYRNVLYVNACQFSFDI